MKLHRRGESETMKYGKYIYKEIDILEMNDNGEITVDYEIWEKRNAQDTIGMYRSTKQIKVFTKAPEKFNLEDRVEQPDRIPYSWLINNIGKTLTYLYHRPDVRRAWFNTARNFGKDYTYGWYKIARQTNSKIPANFMSAQKILSNAKTGYVEQYTEILNDWKLLQSENPEKLPKSMVDTNVNYVWSVKDIQGQPKMVYLPHNKTDKRENWVIDNFIGFDEPNRVKSRKISVGATVQLQVNEFYPEKDDSDYGSKTFLDRISSIRSSVERSCLKFGLPLTKEIFLTNNAQPNDETATEIDTKFPYAVFEEILKKYGLRNITIAWVDYEEEIEGHKELHSLIHGTAFRNPIVRGSYADDLEKSIKNIWDIPFNLRTNDQEIMLYKALGAPWTSSNNETSKYTYDPIRNYLMDEKMRPKVITAKFEEELLKEWRLVHQAFSGDTDFAEEIVCGDRRLFYNTKTKKYVSVLWDVLHIPLEKHKDILYSPILGRIIEKSELSKMTYVWFLKQRIAGVNHIVGIDDDELTYRQDYRMMNNQLRKNNFSIKPLNVRQEGAPKLGKWKIKYRVQQYKRSIPSGFNLYTSRTGKVLIDLYNCKNDKTGKRDEDRGKNSLNWINMDEYGFYEHHSYQNLNPVKF